MKNSFPCSFIYTQPGVQPRLLGNNPHTIRIAQIYFQYTPYASIVIHLRLVPHSIKMFNDGEIRIQEPIHTILRTSLLVLI